MNRVIFLSACLLAAACSGGGQTADGGDIAEVRETIEGAGMFDYASADGTATGRMDMREDGTYTDLQDGEDPRTGKWYATEGQTCFTDDAEGSVEMCWTDSEADENGTFTSTSPDGAVVNVTPVAEDSDES